MQHTYDYITVKRTHPDVCTMYNSINAMCINCMMEILIVSTYIGYTPTTSQLSDLYNECAARVV